MGDHAYFHLFRKLMSQFSNYFAKQRIAIITALLIISLSIYYPQILNANTRTPVVDINHDPALQFQTAAKNVKLSESESVSVWAMGVRVTLKLQAQKPGSGYAIFEDFILPGVDTPFHIHTREEEFWYMLEGELTWYVGDQVFNAKKGDFFNTPRGVRHRFQNSSKQPARMLLGYSPGGFEKWFLDVGEPVVPDAPPPPVTPEKIQKAIKAAEGYGVKFVKP